MNNFTVVYKLILINHLSLIELSALQIASKNIIYSYLIMKEIDPVTRDKIINHHIAKLLQTAFEFLNPLFHELSKDLNQMTTFYQRKRQL